MFGLLARAFTMVARGSWAATKVVAANPVKTAIAAEIADQTLNGGAATGGAVTRAANSAFEKVTGTTTDAIASALPQPVKDVGNSFMGFMKEHPDLAKWGSFAAAGLASYKVLGSLASFIFGDNFFTGALALGAAVLIGNNLSKSFSNAVNNFQPAEPTPAPLITPRQPLPRPAM